MFERFTETARQAVVAAQEQARRTRSTHIGTEHVLLGLLSQDGTDAARVLATVGVDYAAARTRYGAAFEPEERLEGQIPFTPKGKLALEGALREALAVGHNWIGTIHLALGLTRLADGEYVRLLGRDRAVVRAALEEALEAPLDEDPRRRIRDRAARVAEKRPPPSRATEADEPLADTVDAAQAVGLQEAVPTHADRPAQVDALGRRALAEVLAERIRRVRGEDTETPGALHDDGEALLVHLHAPWGAGKSSLLAFLRDELTSPRDRGLARWIVVEFDAWQHQRVAPPWWWLLAAIRREGLRALRRRSWPRAALFWLRDGLWRLWNARLTLVPTLALLALGVLAWRTDLFSFGDDSLKGVGDAAKAAAAVIALAVAVWGGLRAAGRWIAFGDAPPGARVLARVHDPMRASQRRFDFLIGALGDPVAVLVENLDRCRTEYVVELLEGIQTLFLDRPVTYVVAADREWLCESFRAEYERFDRAAGEPGRPLGHLFLEKTFQISIEVPPLAATVRKEFWRGLVRGGARPQEQAPPEDVEQRARELFAGLSSEDQIAAALRAPASDVELEARRRAAVRRLSSPRLERDFEHTLEGFTHLVERNPRAMKRLVNAYGVERALRVRTGADLGDRERAENVLWLIATLRWPRLADHLASYPAHADALAGGGLAPDGISEALLPLFDAPEVRAVFAGEGIDGARLDQAAVRRFLGSGSAPSSAGA